MMKYLHFAEHHKHDKACLCSHGPSAGNILPSSVCLENVIHLSRSNSNIISSMMLFLTPTSPPYCVTWAFSLESHSILYVWHSLFPCLFLYPQFIWCDTIFLTGHVWNSHKKANTKFERSHISIWQTPGFWFLLCTVSLDWGFTQSIWAFLWTNFPLR